MKLKMMPQNYCFCLPSKGIAAKLKDAWLGPGFSLHCPLVDCAMTQAWRTEDSFAQCLVTF